MATQICPKCNNEGFTWRIDEEQTELTIWMCDQCNYRVLEDEKKERQCGCCGTGSQSFMIDEQKYHYWWCSTCNSIEEI